MDQKLKLDQNWIKFQNSKVPKLKKWIKIPKNGSIPNLQNGSNIQIASKNWIKFQYSKVPKLKKMDQILKKNGSNYEIGSNSKNGSIFNLHKWINNQDWIKTGSNSNIPKLKKWIKHQK